MSRRIRKGGLGASKERHRRKLGEGFLQGRLLRLECLEERRLLSLAPIISEVEACNKSGIVDTLGNAADWLEIYNPDPTTAVNLSGWTLDYAKTAGTTNTTWTFPNNVVLGPGAFRVIFCDSSDTTHKRGGPARRVGHGLQSQQERRYGRTDQYVIGTVVSSLTYPALSSDTSYGPAETVTETDLVAAGATASYYAPTSNALGTTWIQPGFNASSWASGPTGLGYATAPGFATTLYRSNLTSTIGSVETAETVINTPADQASVVNETEPVLDFEDSGGVGHFTSRQTAFPGMTIGEGLSNFVMQATGTIKVSASQAGYYTFGVNSDDGFMLTITGANFSNGASTPRAAAARWTTTAAGRDRHPGHHLPGRGQLSAQPGLLPGRGRRQHGVLRRQGEQCRGGDLLRPNSILVGDYGHHRQRRHQHDHDSAGDHKHAVSGGNGGAVRGRRGHERQPAVKAAIATAGSTSLYTRITSARRT